jgi:hypothetical protein
MIKKNIEVVTLIYKSKDYLHFIVDQLKSDFCKVEGWDVGVRVVANDATQEILEELKKIDIPYTVFNNPNPNEFYLNRVYRAYNYAVESSEYDNVCLVNSDNAFSENWLKNLLKYHDGVNIPCSRLVESGKMKSGKHAVNCMDSMGYNFGVHPQNFKNEEWVKYSKDISVDKVEPGGLYMPCVLEKSRVIEAGYYPEGNMFIHESHENGQTKRRVVAGYPNNRPVWKAGDDFFFNFVLKKKYNMKHITVFNSLAYHIQEGEKDE